MHIGDDGNALADGDEVAENVDAAFVREEIGKCWEARERLLRSRRLLRVALPHELPRSRPRCAEAATPPHDKADLRRPHPPGAPEAPGLSYHSQWRR